MKPFRYTILAILLLLFANVSLFAQEKKSRTLELTEEGRQLIMRKTQRADSFNRVTRLNLKSRSTDSTHERQQRLKKHLADSNRFEKQLRIEKFRNDSAHRKMNFRKHDRDSLIRYRPRKDIRSKKVLVSLPCRADVTVSLENVMHNVTILTTDDEKVTLTATVLHLGESSLTDSEWLSKLKWSLSGSGEKIEVKSEDLTTTIATDGRKIDSIVNGIPIFDSLGNIVGARSQSDFTFLLYLPKSANLEIASKYADITFEGNAGRVKASMVNGALRLMDAEQLVTNSSYTRIYAGAIKQADVVMANGKFTVKTIDTLRISSSNSTIGVNKVVILNITNSQADQYNIEEAQHISGKKSFGSLQLAMLAGSVDISGKNANVKIKRINPSATAVNITSQYANLMLPTANLKNYTVAYEGSGGTVHAPFERALLADASFKASVGNGYKKLTAFRLNCQDCTVDFN